jgi:hypothetical protein
MAYYEICRGQDLLPLPVVVEEDVLHFIVTEGGPFAQGWLWHLVAQIREHLDLVHADECLVPYTLSEGCMLHARVAPGDDGWLIYVEFAGHGTAEWM